MRQTLYLASGNPGKLRELAALAAEAVCLELLPDYSQLPAAAEEASSFALNALDKALHYSRFTDGLVVADDSGLVVDALGGAPGTRSARYAHTGGGLPAGPNATDAANNRALLTALADVPDEHRTARYICVLALARPVPPKARLREQASGRYRARRPQLLALFSDTCEGRILSAPRGAGGFGYDPLFFFPPLNRSMAELSLEEKNRHSHRARAFRKLLAYLKETPAVGD
ncbi:MAG: non-canonical purine NTP pyrophosphatase [Terriglobia bacterium]